MPARHVPSMRSDEPVARAAFDPHVFDLLQAQCTGCHSEGGIAGIPVWRTDEQPQPGHTLCQAVLARVDLSAPESSLILRKPAGRHHYGRCRPGCNVDSDPDGPDQRRQSYDLLLRWSLAGACR